MRATLTLDPGSRHWEIFSRLINSGQGVGPLIMDAHLVALSIEYAGTRCTHDRDFSRYQEVKRFDPLA